MDGRIHEEDQERPGQQHLRHQHRLGLLPGLPLEIGELAAAEGIDLDASTAYSDSHTDLPFLEAVGHPVAVNPDRRLRRLARERGWPMLEFSKRLPRAA